MIVYYDKTTGQIVGTTHGRIHGSDHVNMWIGEKEKTERIIVNWIPVAFYDKDGILVDPNSKNIYAADFEPQHEQKDLFFALDKTPAKIYDYKVDIEKKILIPVTS